MPVEKAHPRPPQVGAAEGAALGIPVGTAYQALRSLGVGRRDTLLVHAGSGSVGQAAIQYAVLWGATVIATSSERRFDRVRELGATPVAVRRGLGRPRPRRRTAGCHRHPRRRRHRRGDRDLARAASTTATGSRRSCGGRDAAGFGIRAFSGGSPIPLGPRELAWRREAIPVTLALMAAGAFSVELGASFPLAEAAAAHQAVQDGADGKVTLVP